MGVLEQQASCLAGKLSLKKTSMYRNLRAVAAT
jgi:hypothetical protein